MKIPQQTNPYSANKVFWHTDKIDKLRNGELFPPTNIQIDLEAFCPHDCSFCAYRNAGFNATGMKFFNPDWAPDVSTIHTGQPKGKINKYSHIPKEIALKLLDEMKEEGIKAIEITGGGESLAYPYIKEFLQKCIDNEIEVALVTNGQLLTSPIMELLLKCNLKWIRFSIDARYEDTYMNIHKTKKGIFEKLIKTIKLLKDYKEQLNKDFLIGISFVITKDNYQEIVKASIFWKVIGIDNIRFTFTYDINYDSGLSPNEMTVTKDEIEDALRQETENFKVFVMKERPDYYSTPNDDFSFCGYQFFTWAIGYDGKVYPCCIQKYYDGYEIGDLNNESLKEIIYGEKRKQYIEKFNVKACKPCWLRDKNIRIEQAISKPMHENFI